MISTTREKVLSMLVPGLITGIFYAFFLSQSVQKELQKQQKKYERALSSQVKDADLFQSSEAIAKSQQALEAWKARDEKTKEALRALSLSICDPKRRNAVVEKLLEIFESNGLKLRKANPFDKTFFLLN